MANSTTRAGSNGKRASLWRRAGGFALAALLAGCATTPGASVAGPSTLPTLATASPNADTPAARAWGLTASELTADPDVRYGVLANGMRYALRRNTTPEGTVALRMHVDVGSLAEAEDQRGLAHFLEHMAFNGSTNVPEGEMVKLLERNGLAFGPDTNAYTSFDETVYMLDLPKGTPQLLDTGLMLMRETASNLTLDPKAIERERGVLASERRARETSQLKDLREGLGFFYPDTLLGRRLPIGDAEVVRTAPAERFRAFYDAYYRPERTTLVVVGDMDVDAVEAMIRAKFDDYRGRGPAGADPVIGTLNPSRATAAQIFVDPTVPDLVTLNYARVYWPRPDSVAERNRRTVLALGDAIISRRLARIAQAEGAPFSQAFVSRSELADAVAGVQLIAVTTGADWSRATAAMEQEVRRAREHGFTAAELAEQIAETRTALRNQVANAATRRSQALASALVGAVDGKRIVTTPEDALARFEALATRLTAEEASRTWHAEQATLAAPLLRLSTKAPVAGGEGALLAAFQQSTQVAVAAPVDAKVAAFAYTDFGTPGTVVADDRVADLGIRRVRFANNVMLNIKRTDFQKDRVAMSLRVDGGGLLATRADPYRFALMEAFSGGGLGKHSADELRSALAGRTVETSFGGGGDSFGGTVTTTPADLALQAQLLAAFVTDPGYRADGLAQFRQFIPQIYALLESTPANRLAIAEGELSRPSDPRAKFPPLETILAQDWSTLRAGLDPALKANAIEIGIVGDIDEQAAIDAIARTFGALPMRAAAFDPREDQRTTAFVPSASITTLVHKGDADQAMVASYWQATDDRDQARAARLGLLSQVMQVALTDELREKLGQTYSPNASVDLSSIYRDFGTLSAAANVDYKDMAAAEAAIDAVAKALRDAPVDADTLTRARAPALESWAKAKRENGWWLGYVSRAASAPAELDRARRTEQWLRAATPAELQALARTYLTDARRVRARVVSDKAPK